MSDEQVARVRQYVEKGGELIVIGPVATHNEWMLPRAHPALERLSGDAIVHLDVEENWRPAVLEAGTRSLDIARPVAEKAMETVSGEGVRLYTDRSFAITGLPQELAGMQTIPFSHARAKQDASLRFVAKVPGRAYVAFAPEGWSQQWLDPQPGWKLYREDALDTTIPEIGRDMDVFCRDFEAGPVTLFDGVQGNYVLVGIQARQTPDHGPALSVLAPGSAPLGLCSELTQQKGRRLVHLVNYRADGAIDNLRVRVQLPDGRKAKAVSLANPEREEDVRVPFEQEGGSVRFTVPKVDLYEIAVVSAE